MEERSRSNWTMTDSAQEAFHELEDELTEAKARVKEVERIAREMLYAILDGRRLPSALDPIPECGLQALHPAEPERWRKLLFPENEKQG